MASGVTNRGKYLLGRIALANTDVPTNYYVALCTSAQTPTADTNTMADLTECPNGYGYSTGGYQLARNTTDFDTWSEGDSLDIAYGQVKDVAWTASGGNCPSTAARWAVLTNDDSNPDVLAYFDLSSDRQVSDGQTLTLQDLEIRFTEP